MRLPADPVAQAVIALAAGDICALRERWRETGADEIAHESVTDELLRVLDEVDERVDDGAIAAIWEAESATWALQMLRIRAKKTTTPVGAGAGVKTCASPRERRTGQA